MQTLNVEVKARLPQLMRGVLDTTLRDKVCQ
jgi:hypothetical protein